MDTISVEDFASYVKSAVVTFFSNLLYTSLVAEVPFFATPVISNVTRWIIERGVTFAATKGGLVMFLINTGIFTTSQAKDFNKAIEKLHGLPDNVPDEEWEKHELEANRAFRNLWNFTR